MSPFQQLLLFLLLGWAVHTAIPFRKDSNQAYRDSRAEVIHQKALEFAMAGDYTSAVGYFRTACRLNPNNVRYLNDLGVTEIRLEKFELALQRLATASRIDPEFEFTRMNLEELKPYVSEEQFNSALGPSKPPDQQHLIQCPRQFDSEHIALRRRHWYREEDDYDNEEHSFIMPELKQAYFNEEEWSHSKKLLSAPFVIRKAAQKWGWNLKVASVALLKGEFRSKSADFYPHNMGVESVYPLMTDLGTALEQLELPDGVYPKVDVFTGGATYIQWNIDDMSWRELLAGMNASLPSLLDDRFWMKTCFRDMQKRSLFSYKTHWRMVLIGNENAGMFNHADTLSTASWQIQLRGKKKWHICAPSEAQNLYGAGEVDCFNPDYSKYPKMQNATCLQTTVAPGDMIYYPKGYWHQTKNLSPITMSITDTVIEPDNYKDVTEELKGECAGRPLKARTIFKPDQALCSDLETCYSHWRDIYLENSSRHPNILAENEF